MIEYPAYFKSKNSGCIVKFVSLTAGRIIKLGDRSDNLFKGDFHVNFTPHTNTDMWEQVDIDYVTKETRHMTGIEHLNEAKIALAKLEEMVNEEGCFICATDNNETILFGKRGEYFCKYSMGVIHYFHCSTNVRTIFNLVKEYWDANVVMG